MSDASPKPSHPRLRALALGLAHALILATAFPPLGWWWAVFFAPLPLFVLVRRPGGSVAGAGFWAMVGGSAFWVWTHTWIAGVSMAGVYPLVVWLSLPTWLFVWLGCRATRVRWMPPALGVPLVWLGLEFFRGSLAWSGYPWYLLGHPLIDSPGAALAWPASVGGAYAVSFLVCLPAAWVVWRGVTPVAVRLGVSTVLGVWVAWAAFRPPLHVSADTIRVGVIQTNVPQDNRMDWTTAQRVADWLDMRDLTVDAYRADPRPDLIVWPEGLVPGWTLDPTSLAHEHARGIVWMLNPDTQALADRLDAYPSRIPATRVVDELLALQQAIDVPMLVGAVAYDNLRIVSGEEGVEYEHDAMYNSAFLIQRGRVLDAWYDKAHLTPFGETMPYISAWPWLQDRLLAIGAQGMSFALTPARSIKTLPLDLPGGRSFELATPICFEATMPAVCRRLVNHAIRSGRSVLMVNITNDGWFGASDRGRTMHELCARWRCVELGVEMVRCANTGVSGVIDARGRVRTAAEPRRAVALGVDAHPGGGGTLFARLGDWVGLGGLGLTLLLAACGKRRFSSEPDAGDEGTQG